MSWNPKEYEVVDYDPFSDEVLDDPNPIYRRLRAESPVHFVEKYDSWALTLFEDIWELSMDNEHFTAMKGTSSPYLLTKVIPALPNLNHMDPPEQAELRTKMMHFFMPRRVKSLEGRIRGWVTECIDSFFDEGRGDIVDDLAQVVAVKVFGAGGTAEQGDGKVVDPGLGQRVVGAVADRETKTHLCRRVNKLAHLKRVRLPGVAGGADGFDKDPVGTVVVGDLHGQDIGCAQETDDPPLVGDQRIGG